MSEFKAGDRVVLSSPAFDGWVGEFLGYHNEGGVLGRHSYIHLDTSDKKVCVDDYHVSLYIEKPELVRDLLVNSSMRGVPLYTKLYLWSDGSVTWKEQHDDN